MGRTFFDIARESIGYGSQYEIKGFIDDNLQALDDFEGFPPVISTIRDYQPQPDDCFLCSIGGKSRRQCMERMIEKGGEFINLIHTTARIGTGVKMGVGNLVAAFTSVGANASIGNYNMIQSYTVIGHDARIGDWNRIDTHVTCVGGTQVENDADIYTGAVLNHGVVVENGAHVGANSFAIRRVKAGTTVIGVPARRI